RPPRCAPFPSTTLFRSGAGLLVGVIYSLLQVRSPAPPLVALVGLLGILVGEQVIPVGRQLLTGTSLAAAWQKAACATHIFGLLRSEEHTSELQSRENLV